MKQVLASLPRNLVALLICTFLVACNGSYTAFESDKDFDVDPKTADIEKDTAELITLSALQSALYGHYQSIAYKFLDASDLPLTCSNIEGSVDYNAYGKEAGEEYNVGDRIAVTYNQCMSNGATYSGSLEGKYTKIKGLNNRFINMTTAQCLPRVQKELGGGFSSINTFTYDADNNQYVLNGNDTFLRGSEVYLPDSHSIYYFPGDELRFERVGNLLQVELLRVDFIDDTDDGIDNEERVQSVELSFNIEESQNVIFVLEPLNSNINMVTSIDGDQIYTIEELKETLQKCQTFERTLSVSFNNFSTSKDGFLETILNGSVTLKEDQQSTNRMNQAFTDSEFTTTVVQGNSTQVYYMDSYNVRKEVDLANSSYAYSFQGFINNADVFGGKIALTTLGKLYGSFDSDYPSSGVFEIRAQGLEQINAEPDNNKLEIKVDFNGDSTGNGFADIDAIINTTWVDLFERNFVE